MGEEIKDRGRKEIEGIGGVSVTRKLGEANHELNSIVRKERKGVEEKMCTEGEKDHVRARSQHQLGWRNHFCESCGECG